MSLSINTVTIGGNCTRDPELKAAGSGQVAKLGIAINDKYKTADGAMKESVTFVDCEAWGKTAEVIGQYVHKGDQVVIEGTLKSDSWETANGEKRHKLMVRVNRIHFVGNKRAEDTRAVPAPKPRAPALPQADAPDEIPF